MRLINNKVVDVDFGVFFMQPWAQCTCGMFLRLSCWLLIGDAPSAWALCVATFRLYSSDHAYVCSARGLPQGCLVVQVLSHGPIPQISIAVEAMDLCQMISCRKSTLISCRSTILPMWNWARWPKAREEVDWSYTLLWMFSQQQNWRRCVSDIRWSMISRLLGTFERALARKAWAKWNWDLVLWMLPCQAQGSMKASNRSNSWVILSVYL
jgi:hypothetical protein